MKKKKNNYLIPIAAILVFLIVLTSTIRKITLASDINISSQIYTINNNMITNISSNTSINLFKKYFDLDNCYLKITDENNIEITEGYIYTGSKTVVYNNGNTLINTYTNIITGDITKDGMINTDDTNKIQNYLDNTISLTTEEIKAADINKDNNITIEDKNQITELLDSSYQSLSLNKESIQLMVGEQDRIIATINPNIILNQNLNWSSSNPSVVSVDESGKIIASQVGEATITASTKNNQISRTVSIVVDNKPILSIQSLQTYRGAYDSEIGIKALNYDELTCSVLDPNVASCRIENRKLIITPIVDGETTVTVNSPSYGETNLALEVLFTSFSIQPKAGCVPKNVSISGGTRVSGFHFGDLSVKSIEDREIIRSAGISRYGFYVESGSKAGDSKVVFTESNGHNESTFTAYVYELSLSAPSGSTPLNGKKLVAKINAQNAGNVTCISDNPAVATCSVANDYLTVTQVSEGNATITVKGDKCGSAQYMATITEELNEDNYLSKLSVEGLNIIPLFNKDVSDYALTTEQETINIIATKNNELATISGDVGGKRLSYGANLFQITVTSQLGIERKYNLTVTRPLPKETPKTEDKKDKKDNNKTNNNDSNTTMITDANDVSLSDIEIGNYDLNFDKNTFKYELTVGGSTDKLDINAIPTSASSKIEIIGSDSLKTGENIVTINVTSKSGDVCKYVIVVNKKALSEDTSIKQLTIKNYELDFQKDKYEYELLIKKGSKLDIKVVLNDPNATYEIKGNEKLKNGSTITITVTSEAKTKKDYIINIIKKQPSDINIINDIPLATIIGILLIVTSLSSLIIRRILKKH